MNDRCNLMLVLFLAAMSLSASTARGQAKNGRIEARETDNTESALQGRHLKEMSDGSSHLANGGIWYA
jgi:hypothetical protein